MPARGAGWHVYVLRCGDGSLYAGATNDLPRRVERHARGKGARYTRSRLPVVLVHAERAADRGAALRREAALKRLPRAAKLALVAQGDPEPRRDRRPARAPAAPPPPRSTKGGAGQRLDGSAASSGKSRPRMKRVPSGMR